MIQNLLHKITYVIIFYIINLIYLQENLVSYTATNSEVSWILQTDILLPKAFNKNHENGT